MDIIQKTREDYNKIAQHFSATRYQMWPGLDQFKLLLRDGQHILDWGCGSGRLVAWLDGRNVEYFGIDQSSELLKLARRRFAGMIHDGKAHFYCTARRQKKFPAEFFDLAFLIASFHHLPDEASRLGLLKKLYRELKPTGELIIMVWNHESDWSQEKAKSGWKKIGDNDYLIPWKNPRGEIEVERYYHSFSPKELTTLLALAGFTVERMKYQDRTDWSDGKKGMNLVAVARK